MTRFEVRYELDAGLWFIDDSMRFDGSDVAHTVAMCDSEIDAQVVADALNMFAEWAEQETHKAAKGK